jgi:hypothetical protein
VLNDFGTSVGCRSAALSRHQRAIELGDPELPHQKGTRHHALHDARWTKEAWVFLSGLHPAGAERRCIGRKHPDQAGAA